MPDNFPSPCCAKEWDENNNEQMVNRNRMNKRGLWRKAMHLHLQQANRFFILAAFDWDEQEIDHIIPGYTTCTILSYTTTNIKLFLNGQNIPGNYLSLMGANSINHCI
jgi:hypothetical protein